MEKREDYKGFWFSVNTPIRLRDVILRAYENRLRVRIHQGNVATGEVWLDEHDVMGRIGRSTGAQKIPLLIPRANSLGGGGLLDHCILGIQLISTRQWLYRADNIRMPDLRYGYNDTGADNIGNHHEVLMGDEVQARFYTEQKARNYMAFMKGERMRAA